MIMKVGSLTIAPARKPVGFLAPTESRSTANQNSQEHKKKNSNPMTWIT